MDSVDRMATKHLEYWKVKFRMRAAAEFETAISIWLESELIINRAPDEEVATTDGIGFASILSTSIRASAPRSHWAKTLDEKKAQLRNTFKT